MAETAATTASMTFEERLKLKQRSGFDTIKTKEDVLIRKEQAGKVKEKAQQSRKDLGSKNFAKKMPRERFSKLPVSVLRPLNLDSGIPGGASRRDPRFDNLSGQLNDGLFKESYSFVKEIRDERINQLKGYINEAKEQKGHESQEKVRKLRDMLGEERDAMNKAAQKNRDKNILKEVKQENRERAEKGLEPKFYKKRELKEFRHKDQFEKLDKSGKLKEFMEKKQEENDKRRVRR